MNVYLIRKVPIQRTVTMKLIIIAKMYKISMRPHTSGYLTYVSIIQGSLANKYIQLINNIMGYSTE